MSNTENLQLSSQWNQTLTNNPSQDICVYSPRRSGKTTALIKLFLESPPSLYVCRSIHESTRVQSLIDENIDTNHQLWAGNHVISVRSYGVTSGDFFRGRRYNTVFFDDICSYYTTNITELMRNATIGSDRIVAASTPTTHEWRVALDRHLRGIEFRYNFNNLNLVTKVNRTNEPVTSEHFKDEGDLFTI